MNTRSVALASSALTITLLLAGCAPSAHDPAAGGDHSTPTIDASAANQADADFAMNMVAHHEQAIEMADMLLAKDDVRPEVADLALAIKAAQGPEIETMNSWLDAWGFDNMSGMDHGGGMMSDADMAALDEASGNEASRLFLEQMIEHHQGAIEMATEEEQSGRNPDALALARKIIEDQTSEIETMRELLASA